MIKRSIGLVVFFLAGAVSLCAGTFPLHYTTGGATAEFQLPLGRSEIQFKAEPAYAGERIVRSVLYLSADQQEYIAFACDIDTRTLYLDLNRNLDLTDDPDGVYQAPQKTWQREFKDVVIPVEQDGRRREIVTDIVIYRDNYGRYAVKSSWESDSVVIGDRTYRVSIVDDGDGVITRSDALFLSPIGESPEAAAVLPVELKAPAALVLDGQAWQLSYSMAADGQVLELSVEPASSRLLEVELTGENVERLVMESVKMAAVYFHPEDVIQVPAGRYSAGVWTRITQGDRSSLWHARGVSFHLDEKDAPASWSVGGPIVSSLCHTMSGDRLTFSQATRGAEGASYTLVDATGVSFGKPKLRVMKAGQVIHVGEFEYG